MVIGFGGTLYGMRTRPSIVPPKEAGGVNPAVEYTGEFDLRARKPLGGMCTTRKSKTCGPFGKRSLFLAFLPLAPGHFLVLKMSTMLTDMSNFLGK